MAIPSEQVHKQNNEFLKSTFPVLIPAHPALTCDCTQFTAFLKDVETFDGLVSGTTHPEHRSTAEDAAIESNESATLVSEVTASTTAEVRNEFEGMNIELGDDDEEEEDENTEKNNHPFMKALHSTSTPPASMANLMRTENNDLTNASTTEPLLDLFAELEEVVSGPRLNELLESAWIKDPLSTLKIIFNARSIHIGKSSRTTTYRCLGWLASNHPVTLLTNLQWLSRPIIEKKVGEKKENQSDDAEWVEVDQDENDPSRFDVKNGVAHGYWKDLLNILALAADGKLHVLANPRDLLNIEKGKNKDKTWDQVKAKEIRTQKKIERHEKAVRLFEDSSFYRALYLTVARLFAEQLKSDLRLLKSENKKAARQISLCAKWAPSMGLFHDKRTFIVSSVAEILHPQSEFPDIEDRELYLRHAREAYRKDVSALRKSLEIVERDIAAGNFANIKYDRVPSLAMNQYKGLFIEKDHDHFDQYLEQVAGGQASISGAVLLPSTLVSAVRGKVSRYGRFREKLPKGGVKGMIESKKADMDLRVVDEQWKTLVKRIKDSGKLENSIAVADVSGSMTSPRFPDHTCPIDSAIGLSLLLAEVTAPPFGGTFITFSTNPTVQGVKGATFTEKVENLESAEWGMSTDVVAVFRDLILPLALKHKVKQEDMVKQVFIFSDMQFNQGASTEAWTSSYDRIKQDYANTGYEMPNLVFWNLAGGRAGMTGDGNPIAPKPVTAADESTSLVSGYSQGTLKVFLDSGAFEDPEAVEEVVIEETGEDGEIVQVTKKQKMDPMSTLRKAISHKSYSMLKVVD